MSRPLAIGYGGDDHLYPYLKADFFEAPYFAVASVAMV